ncbi:MBL fold metallo-hydrolase [Streptomyces decoyicus]|uniref:MBL fold metallo-hydrolase n=1 Tax=Streptomyces decoyicus TaxID=249567 RepID=UPI0039A76616
MIGNLDRLGVHPDTFETIVLSHGHLDHVTGLHGLVRRLGRPGPIRPDPPAGTAAPRRVAAAPDRRSWRRGWTFRRPTAAPSNRPASQ